jgi:hypothetical protein
MDDEAAWPADLTIGAHGPVGYEPNIRWETGSGL